MRSTATPETAVVGPSRAISSALSLARLRTATTALPAACSTPKTLTYSVAHCQGQGVKRPPTSFSHSSAIVSLSGIARSSLA